MGLSELLWNGSKFLPIYIFIIYILTVSIRIFEKKIDKVIAITLAVLIGLFVSTRLLSIYFSWALIISIPLSYLILIFVASLLIAFWTPSINKNKINYKYAAHWLPLIVIIILYGVRVF